MSRNARQKPPEPSNAAPIFIDVLASKYDSVSDLKKSGGPDERKFDRVRATALRPKPRANKPPTFTPVTSVLANATSLGCAGKLADDLSSGEIPSAPIGSTRRIGLLET